jgi:hypothetical protein
MRAAALRPWIGVACLLATTAAPALAQAPEVAVTLKWDYRDLPGPMRVYAVAPGARNVLWETGNAESPAKLPIGEELTDRAIPVERGAYRRLVLVYANAADQPAYFFAAPHSARPEESALGFKFRCLCVDHAFEARPKRFWYRIVELRIAADFVGDQLTISHVLIGIDRARKEKFSKPPLHDG